MENNNNKQPTKPRTDSLLMRLKKCFFGKSNIIRYNLSSQTFSTLDGHTRFSTPPPAASKVEEEDVIGQQVEEAALDAGSVFTSEQTSKKKKFCFKVRKSRHDAGRTASVAKDNLQSRLLSQEMKIKDMEEDRKNMVILVDMMVILVDMMRTKIAAMEKDKEMRKFQLLDMARRLVEMESKMTAVLEEEANLLQKGRLEKWAEKRLQEKDTLSQT